MAKLDQEVNLVCDICGSTDSVLGWGIFSLQLDKDATEWSGIPYCGPECFWYGSLENTPNYPEIVTRWENGDPPRQDGGGVFGVSYEPTVDDMLGMMLRELELDLEPEDENKLVTVDSSEPSKV